jgi:hypothetical protein
MKLGPLHLDFEKAIRHLASEICNNLKKEFNQKGAKAMEDLAREHVKAKYPGSVHWDPSKINAYPQKTAAAVDIDIPGAVRNYWDVDIYPKKADYLTIPTEYALQMGVPMAWGQDTFRLKGTDVIAAVLNGSLVALFILSKHVHQERDPTLLPTDEEFVNAICAEVTK